MSDDASRAARRDHQGCATCSSLRGYERAVQYVQADETAEGTDDKLPEAVGRLQSVPTFRGGPDLMRCPECGTWYLYETAYEFLIGFGGSYDEQTVTRLSDAEAIGYLEGSTEPVRDSEATVFDAEATARAAIGYATRMAQAYIARAGQRAAVRALPGDSARNWEPTPTSSWYDFGGDLEGALIPHTSVLEDPDYLAFLRELFADLFDFLMVVYRGNPAPELAELYRAFGAGIDCGPILPLLLPERARKGTAPGDTPVMAEVERILEAEYEDERRRQDQMGY